MNISEIADRLSSVLKNEGIIIQKRSVCDSESIYLNLDYGFIYSIRISDHPGKPYLRYRYNIGSYINVSFEASGEPIRFYYNIFDYNLLLDRIICDKNVKLEVYGKDRYNRIVQTMQGLRENQKGFWKNATLI